MRYSFCFLVFACGLFGLLLINTACDSDDSSDDDPGYGDYVAEGKMLLAENDADAAAIVFDRALAVEPAGGEARFGLVISGSMRFLNFIDEVIATVSSISFNPEEADLQRDRGGYAPDVELPTVTNPIHEFLRDSVYAQIARGQIVFDELKERSDPTFATDYVALAFDDAPFIEFGGEFDRTDLFFFGAMNSALDGVMRLLFAHNMNFDYNAVGIDPNDLSDLDTFGIIDLIVDILSDLLYSEAFPDFLYLEEETGVEHMRAAGIALGSAFARMREAFEVMAAETDDQADDQLAYVDANGNGRYDAEIDPVRFGATEPIAPEIAATLPALADELSRAFLDGSTLDPDPNSENNFTLADLNPLLTAVGLFPLDLGTVTIEGFPDWLEVNLGEFFADPSPDAVRNLLETLVTLWEDPRALFDR